MKNKLILLAGILLIIATISTICLSEESKKATGWVCWHTCPTNKIIGTYGYSQSKKVAIEESARLCEKECEKPCVRDYCEQL